MVGDPYAVGEVGYDIDLACPDYCEVVNLERRVGIELADPVWVRGVVNVDEVVGRKLAGEGVGESVELHLKAALYEKVAVGVAQDLELVMFVFAGITI